MPRAATTADVFNAIAEPQRRRIMELLAPGERSVGDVSRVLRMAQPTASKHLKVLKEVGLVTVREDGQHRLYKLEPQAIRPIFDWARRFEDLWTERFDQLDELLEDLQASPRAADGRSPS